MTVKLHWPHTGEAACYQACPNCRRHTFIAAPDGYRVRADLEHLSIQGELIARLQERETFDVMVYGFPRAMHLAWRDIDRIRAPRKYPVVATHHCDRNLAQHAAKWDRTITELIVSYRNGNYPEKPPF